MRRLTHGTLGCEWPAKLMFHVERRRTPWRVLAAHGIPGCERPTRRFHIAAAAARRTPRGPLGSERAADLSSSRTEAREERLSVALVEF